jgi:hypothetical protein
MRIPVIRLGKLVDKVKEIVRANQVGLMRTLFSNKANQIRAVPRFLLQLQHVGSYSMFTSCDNE